MKYRQSEILAMIDEAIKIMQNIGRAIGYTYRERDEVVHLIETHGEDYLAECEERDAPCDPMRIAYGAIVEHRKNEECKWKPWIDWRFAAIQRRYSNWREQFDPNAGVARRYVPDSFTE